MQPGGKLRAWIETKDGMLRAAFVGVHNALGQPQPGRVPATRSCASIDEATCWVETEAAQVGLPVEWVGPDGAQNSRNHERL